MLPFSKKKSVSDMDGFVVAYERINCDPADQGLRGTPVTTWSSSYRCKDPEVTPDEDSSFRQATVFQRGGLAHAFRLAFGSLQSVHVHVGRRPKYRERTWTQAYK